MKGEDLEILLCKWPGVMDKNHSHLGQEKPMFFFVAVGTEMVAINFNRL